MDDRSRATANAYDSAAVDFADRTASRSQLAAEFLDQFMRALTPGSLIADLGCGPGHDLRRLDAAGFSTVGLDRSEGLLKLCTAPSHRIRGDLRSLPIASDSIDAIWSSAALLHVDHADVAATFREWDRALVPAGVVAFATSLGGDQGWELAPASRSRVPEIAVGHQRWFVHHTQESLAAAVEAVGWQIVGSNVRSSTRNWLQLIATKPAPK